MASSISRQAPKRPSTTKSVSTPARPSLTRTQSNTSKVRANSAGAPSPSGRTRTPKVVSKKPRREKRSRSARISRWRAWKNASEGNETDIDFGPKAYSRRAGCVKPELAMARLGSGVERRGSGGEADGVDQVAQPGGEALVVEARWIREGREVAHAAPRKVAAQEEEVRRVPEQPVHQHDRRRVRRARIEAIALDDEAERHRERRGAQRRNFGPDHPQADHPPRLPDRSFAWALERGRTVCARGGGRCQEKR